MRASLALAALALPLAIAGCSHPRPVVYDVPPPPAYTQVAQRGFHDGFDAARRDLAKGIRPDVDRHPKFRSPPVPPPAFEDYRHGFREGYQRALHAGPGGY
ncbi:MAG TPA: hypothetical protein VGI45_15105 [Terracidiphilus sp.]|jgi:hypothetical protein